MAKQAAKKDESWLFIANGFETEALIDPIWPSTRNGHWYEKLAAAIEVATQRDMAHLSVVERAVKCYQTHRRLLHRRMHGLADASLSQRRQYLSDLMDQTGCVPRMPGALFGCEHPLIDALHCIDNPKGYTDTTGGTVTSAPKIVASLRIHDQELAARIAAEGGETAALSVLV